MIATPETTTSTPLTPAALELRRKLLGGQFVPLRRADLDARIDACQRCAIRRKGFCGEPRGVLELQRDEEVTGNGYPLETRQRRPECRCPAGKWNDEAVSVRRSDDRYAVVTTGFTTSSRSAALLAKKLTENYATVQILDERTPCVALARDIAPLYAFDLYPDAEYVAYISPDLFLFPHAALPRFEDLDEVGLYAYRLPSPYCRYYGGFFVAHRDMRVLFEAAKDQGGGGGGVLWWEFVQQNAIRSGVIHELHHAPAILFPFRQRVPESGRPPEAICLEGVEDGERERLLAQMYTSPAPWREVCRHFYWRNELRAAPPYPPGTHIAIDCNTAGIGDIIDVAHIAEALRAENPGVKVSVYTKTAKRSFVDLYGNFGAIEYAQVRHELPPSPWHKLDETAFARTRIENWAMYCGASEPRLATPFISDAAKAFGASFTRNMVGRRVALSPISTCPTRSWPLDRYEALGLLLQKAGCDVIMVDEPEGTKTRHMSFERLYGKGAECEAAVVANCHLLVGNDSGMAHLSCSLEIPTLVLCGPTDGAKVFSWYRKAFWMDGGLPCRSCYFYGHKGWRDECAHGCLDILQIQVDDVFKASLRVLEGAVAPGRLEW